MRYEHFSDECEIFEDARAVREADEGWLIDAAFRELLQGRFDSELVHEALKLGHHPEQPRLAYAAKVAERVARHARSAA